MESISDNARYRASGQPGRKAMVMICAALMFSLAWLLPVVRMGRKR
jgi:hypothetical protein